MWRVKIIHYKVILILFSVVLLACSAKRISIDQAYSSLRPLKQIELPEQVTDNLHIIIDNVADEGTSYKNYVQVFVNDKSLTPNWDISNTETNYTYKLKVRPGYYKIKANYFAYIGWGEEKYEIKTLEEFVRVPHDKITVVHYDIVKKSNGMPVDKNMYFKLKTEPLVVQPNSHTGNVVATQQSIQSDVRSDEIVLQINTVPDNARIIVDDKTIGLAPIKIKVDRNVDHIVQIVADGYKTAVKYLDHSNLQNKTIFHLVQELEKSLMIRVALGVGFASREYLLLVKR